MTVTRPPQHAYPGMPFNLRPEGASLADATTFTLVKEQMFEAIRLVIRKDRQMLDHQVAGPITIYCLAGRIAFTARGETRDLKPGHWLFLLGNEPHSLRGIEDSSLLLTIMFPNSREGSDAQAARENQLGAPTGDADINEPSSAGVSNGPLGTRKGPGVHAGFSKDRQ